MALTRAHIDGRVQDLKVLRKTFVPGEEKILTFTNPNVFQSYGEAREAAKVFAGLGPDEQTEPCLGTSQYTAGRVVGSQSRGGLRGWRIDVKPERKGKQDILKLHVNWWDHSEDPEPGTRKNKKLWYTGANFVQGADGDFYYQIFEHFPNPFSTPV